ncbi:MAG TPA: hypothetical protein VIM87_03025, partial [Chitinophaga sp.]
MLPNSTCRCFSAILFYLLLLIPYHGSGQDGQAQQLVQLSKAINNVPVYDAQRQHRIDSLKRILAQVAPADFSKQFNVYTLLYEEYRLFQYDSSYHYARKLGETALLLKDNGRIMYARIKLAFSLLS